MRTVSFFVYETMNHWKAKLKHFHRYRHLCAQTFNVVVEKKSENFTLGTKNKFKFKMFFFIRSKLEVQIPINDIILQ